MAAALTPKGSPLLLAAFERSSPPAKGHSLLTFSVTPLLPTPPCHITPSRVKSATFVPKALSFFLGVYSGLGEDPAPYIWIHIHERKCFPSHFMTNLAPFSSVLGFLPNSFRLDTECLCSLLGTLVVTLKVMPPRTLEAPQSTPALSLPGIELAVASPLTSSPRTSCLYRLITWVRLSLACRISAGIGRTGEVV